ncbi:hypothetical protein FHX42_003041 [Saccharopolyspora lacisalsi]|uniref:Lipoprotein n=1 Tax=Halosaccharopolyspora lacisalsi TaxID=1000566 RepID=A0A839E1S8_9PSEU|nr:hypothetical protein [Halosaccharopolyspora lacisalsi]MBA8825675.1 hypothetical protein [Halosaccharopolyspora lacisalsi]
MRRLYTAVGAGALLLAVAACADKQPEVGFGGQPPAPPPSKEAPTKPVKPKPVEQREQVPAASVEAQLPEGYPRQVWTQNEGTVVVATGQEGGCSRVHAEVARENTRRVTVVLVEEIPQQPQMCTMDIRYPEVAAKLDAPLGKRTIVLQQRDVKVPK